MRQWAATDTDYGSAHAAGIDGSNVAVRSGPPTQPAILRLAAMQMRAILQRPRGWRTPFRRGGRSSADDWAPRMASPSRRPLALRGPCPELSVRLRAPGFPGAQSRRGQRVTVHVDAALTLLVIALGALRGAHRPGTVPGSTENSRHLAMARALRWQSTDAAGCGAKEPSCP